MIKPLLYHSKNGICIEFNKYTIDDCGIIKNDRGEAMAYTKNKEGYNRCGVYDDSKKQRHIFVCRAVASTFIGPPPTPAHTPDHLDQNPDNDSFVNIRWLCKSGQRYNQTRPETYKSAFIIVNGGEERTINEWVDYLKNKKNHMGRKYTSGMINHYAQKNQHGFSYKKYDDLPDEVWKEIIGSNNKSGRWEISNMNRVKYITNNAEHVLSGEMLGLFNGYPKIMINGKGCLCHILSFMTFFPEKYAARKPDDMVLHEDDVRLDFRPHKLRLGSGSQNRRDAYDNGRHDGTKTDKMRCVSYIKGIFEKEHDSQRDAAKYLKSIGYEKASGSAISRVLSEYRNISYDRTWKLII